VDKFHASYATSASSRASFSYFSRGLNGADSRFRPSRETLNITLRSRRERRVSARAHHSRRDRPRSLMIVKELRDALTTPLAPSRSPRAFSLLSPLIASIPLSLFLHPLRRSRHARRFGDRLVRNESSRLPFSSPAFNPPSFPPIFAIQRFPTPGDGSGRCLIARAANDHLSSNKCTKISQRSTIRHDRRCLNRRGARYATLKLRPDGG